MDEYLKILKRLVDELSELERGLSKSVKGARAELRILLPIRTALKTLPAVLRRLHLVEPDGHIKKETKIPLMFPGRGVVREK